MPLLLVGCQLGKGLLVVFDTVDAGRFRCVDTECQNAQYYIHGAFDGFDPGYLVGATTQLCGIDVFSLGNSADKKRLRHFHVGKLRTGVGRYGEGLRGAAGECSSGKAQGQKFFHVYSLGDELSVRF